MLCHLNGWTKRHSIKSIYLKALYNVYLSVQHVAHGTLLSTNRFLIHPVKCFCCSCGYSYDVFSLMPPSCSTWLPFRYLATHINCQYTKHCEKMKSHQTLQFKKHSPSKKETQNSSWQKENTHHMPIYSLYHFRIISYSFSSFVAKTKCMLG